MSHDRIRESLDDYLDGVLTPEAAREVEAHLEGCAACRDEIDALRSLLAEVAELARSIEPPRDLWPQIDSQIARPSWGGRTFWSMRYPLAAAAVLLIAISSLVTALLVERTSGRVATDLAPTVTGTATAASAGWQQIETEYLRATAELMEPLEATRTRLAPETLELIEESLRIIDSAIREVRAALAADPGSRELMEMLSVTYEKKIEVLQQVSRL